MKAVNISRLDVSIGLIAIDGKLAAIAAQRDKFNPSAEKCALTRFEVAGKGAAMRLAQRRGE